nr:cytochrome b5-like isoform X1 [Megalopta genalis]
MLLLLALDPRPCSHNSFIQGVVQLVVPDAAIPLAKIRRKLDSVDRGTVLIVSVPNSAIALCSDLVSRSDFSDADSREVQKQDGRMSKTFTRSEVADGSGKEKTLIILHDKVYDVTCFLNEHPGGEEILQEHSGKDGSEDFDDVGHSKDAFDLMKKYVVGELVDSEKSNKNPKEGWASSYGKETQKKEEDGMNPLALGLVVAIFAAILYFVYL